MKYLIVMLILSFSVFSLFWNIENVFSEKQKEESHIKTKKSTKISVKTGSIKVDGTSSINIGGSGKSTKGKVTINDTPIDDTVIKSIDKNSTIEVSNNRAWVDGKEINLKTGKFVETQPKVRKSEDIVKLRQQLRNFFGKNWKNHIKPKFSFDRKPLSKIFKMPIKKPVEKKEFTSKTNATKNVK